MSSFRDDAVLRWLLWGALLLALLGALVSVHVHFTRQNPGGTDFLDYWVAARHFLLQGESPYSQPLILDIQRRIYGRPAYAWEDQHRPIYPFHFVFLFAPFALVGDYPLARALWMVVNEVLLVVGVLLWLSLLPWKPRPLALGALLLYTLLGYFSVRGLINGNFVVLQTAFFLLGVYALARGRDGLGGAILALTTVKPHIALLPLVLVALWSASRRRWGVWLGLGGTLIALLGAATWLQPDWWLQDLRLILAYPSYTPPGSPQEVLRLALPGLGRLLAWVLTALVWGVLLAEWVALWGRSFTHFLWTFSLTLLASQWSGIQTDPGNLMVTLPALVVVWGYWCTRWAYGRRLFWGTWVLAMVGNWALFLSTLRWVGGQPIQSPVLYFPFPMLVFFMLYTVRVWATRVPLLREDVLFVE